MGNSALILYASNTGNTEKVASRFAQVLERYGWDSKTLHLQEDTDFSVNEIYLDDYDLVLLGTPVICSSVAPILTKKLALSDINPPRLYSNQMIFPGSLFRPEKAPLGIVFATYSGESFGPCEVLPTLETESIILKYLFMDIVGKFACPGRKEAKDTIDLLATELGLGPNETVQMINRYERNPAHSCFASISEDCIALLQQAVYEKTNKTVIPFPDEFPQEVWHHNISSRPSDRDLMKADIFLSEILEDYFTVDGLPRKSGSVYISIG